VHIFSFEFKPFLQFLLSLSCSLILTAAVTFLILTSELGGNFSLATFEITKCSEIALKVFFKTRIYFAGFVAIGLSFPFQFLLMRTQILTTSKMFFLIKTPILFYFYNLSDITLQQAVSFFLQYLRLRYPFVFFYCDAQERHSY